MTKRIRAINVVFVCLAISAQLFAQQQAKPREQWASTLRICREQLERRSPDNEKLGMSLANLAAAVYNEKTVYQALSVFEEAEGQKKLPVDARPYYAQLLLEKYDNYSLQSLNNGNLSPPADRSLLAALQLFLQAYSDEAQKGSIDRRKLADIGWRITRVYERLGKSDEAAQWMRTLLNSPVLSDGARAVTSYYLAVHYWKKAYDLASGYIAEDRPLPDADVPRVRDWVSEAYSYIDTTHSLDPKHANAWFYENSSPCRNTK